MNNKHSEIIKSEPIIKSDTTNKREISNKPVTTFNKEIIPIVKEEPKLKSILKQEPEQSISTNLYVLDPLSVIIKLVIISHKPIGTKISIYNNLIGIQEPGIFQPLVRYIMNNNKDDLHYLYNPIEYACRNFLTETMTEKMPNIVKLFECALTGITKLIETYKNSPMSVICLNYYTNLINNYLVKLYNRQLFKPDEMTKLYTSELLSILIKKWTDVKLQAVLDLNQYLMSNDNSTDNMNGLEIFMNDFDIQIQKIKF